MRQEYWKGNSYSGCKMVKYICDKCKTVIDEVELSEDCRYNSNLSEKYAGMSIGTHECDRCRKSRERAYDAWAERQRTPSLIELI